MFGSFFFLLLLLFLLSDLDEEDVPEHGTPDIARHVAFALLSISFSHFSLKSYFSSFSICHVRDCMTWKERVRPLMTSSEESANDGVPRRGALAAT